MSMIHDHSEGYSEQAERDYYEEMMAEQEIERQYEERDAREALMPDEPPPTQDEFRAWESEEDQERREVSEHGPDA